MQDFEIFMAMILVIAFIIGMVMVSIGLNDYEEGMGYVGLIVIFLVVSFGIIGFTTSLEEEETDRHTKINYEELCYENGGDYLIIEGAETCVVEE